MYFNLINILSFIETTTANISLKPGKFQEIKTEKKNTIQ